MLITRSCVDSFVWTLAHKLIVQLKSKGDLDEGSRSIVPFAVR